jgi:hypothetical protein
MPGAGGGGAHFSHRERRGSSPPGTSPAGMNSAARRHKTKPRARREPARGGQVERTGALATGGQERPAVRAACRTATTTMSRSSAGRTTVPRGGRRHATLRPTHLLTDMDPSPATPPSAGTPVRPASGPRHPVSPSPLAFRHCGGRRAAPSATGNGSPNPSAKTRSANGAATSSQTRVSSVSQTAEPRFPVRSRRLHSSNRARAAPFWCAA